MKRVTRLAQKNDRLSSLFDCSDQFIRTYRMHFVGWPVRTDVCAYVWCCAAGWSGLCRFIEVSDSNVDPETCFMIKSFVLFLVSPVSST
jgi:hypothetical protein